MRSFCIRSAGALVAGLVAVWPAVGAEGGAPAFDLKSGQELTFAVTIAEGKVTLSAPRPSKLGAAQPKDGEMTVGLTARDKTGYEQLLVTEKTTAPIDFVATGLVGNIKIDERVVCGRLDAPTTQRIGASNWRVRLQDFEARKAGATCE